MKLDKYNLAKKACQIEMDFLGLPVGKQDQFISSFGGLKEFHFRKKMKIGRLKMSPLSPTSRQRFEKWITTLLYRRSPRSSTILSQQKGEGLNSQSSVNSSFIKAKAMWQVKDLIGAGDIEGFGEMLNEHWQNKRSSLPGMTNDMIDKIYEYALSIGAIGGKLVGAGAEDFFCLQLKIGPNCWRAFIEGALFVLRLHSMKWAQTI